MVGSTQRRAYKYKMLRIIKRAKACGNDDNGSKCMHDTNYKKEN